MQKAWLTLLRPFLAGEMESYPVTTLVNNPRNETRPVWSGWPLDEGLRDGLE